MLFEQGYTGTLTAAAGCADRAGAAAGGMAPRFDLLGDTPKLGWTENALELLRGPAAPREFQGEPFFRDCWVSRALPRRAMAASALWHAASLLLLIPFWGVVFRVPPQPAVQRTEITWYGPIDDLPAISPRISEPKARPKALRKLATDDLSQGADAFHPRQTIVMNPLRPNHRRQTLIQPAAPPEPPKILPALPNIVAWTASAQPELSVDPRTLTRMRPKAVAARPQQDVPLPDLPNQEQQLGALSIAASDPAIPKPALSVNPMSAPRTQARRRSEQAVPEIAAPVGGAVGNTQLIALSATPAPVAPPAVPAGNLASRVTISPEGPKPGNGGAATSRVATGGSGPAGLSISGGGANRLITSGLGRTGPVPPGVAAARPPEVPSAATNPTRREPAAARLQPGMNPEALLGSKRVYTLYVDMPNLTSAAGSWRLTFAELDPSEALAHPSAAANDLQGPEPLRKVDPKYPPELRGEHVQGDVVLYAVIRADGSVDSVELVSGIDPTLDANAMQALAQWKFRPGERHGSPVDLEAVVRIPFRSTAPGE